MDESHDNYANVSFYLMGGGGGGIVMCGVGLCFVPEGAE